MFHFHWIFCIFTLCIPFTIFPQFSNNKITFRCSSITIYIEHHTSRFHFFILQLNYHLRINNPSAFISFIKLFVTKSFLIIKVFKIFSWIQAQRFVEVFFNLFIFTTFFFFHSASPYKNR
ncbi:Uncharacterised protein [Staphylococcus aureus]|nr:Uncharacterised protein [Staphylococcus aureus]